MVSIKRFLEGLMIASEKASRISRIIRAAYWTGDNGACSNIMLTEDKVDRLDGSPDFKTLADVLCQTVIDSELRKMFPTLKEVHGEENGSFQGCGADTLHVQINDKMEDTESMLAKASLNPSVVSSLSTLIHSKLELPTHITDQISPHASALDGIDLDLSKVGVWIDPIDATTEYVKAKKTVVVDGLCFTGLACSTVIIGAYNTTNGQPLVGVISRPFDARTCDSGNFSETNTEVFWGCYHPDSSLNLVGPGFNSITSTQTKLRMVLSSGERMPFVVYNSKFERLSPKGAGNKLLAVAKGQADIYLITLESHVVFRWDTCAGHAILKAKGGGILNYKQTLDSLQSYKGSIQDFPFSDYEIDYRGSHDPLSDGIVAYADPQHVITFFSELQAYLQRE